MNLYDVIKKPVITESSMAQLEAGKYFCKDIREVSEPGAIMLNYSNPNAM